MRFITATQIFNGIEFLTPQTAIVIDENKTIVDLVNSETIESSKIESYEGIISPGFINTHCHLELSHLKNEIPQKTGIVNFALDVIKKRNTFSLEQQKETMFLADSFMQEQGIVAVGDISNTINSIDVKNKSGIHYHTFVELLGFNPQMAEQIYNQGLEILKQFTDFNLPVSLAPHAPYSASKELIQLISKNCDSLKKPTSIHNQESKAENEFFISKEGDFLKLYETLGISINYFNSTKLSSLSSILNSLQKNVSTLLVHNTFTNSQDIKNAQNQISNLYWCLCPNANLYIENTLPNIDLLISQNCELTLGTDSLASNSMLSIIEEINTLKKHFPHIELNSFLKMATYNGAKFLGIEDRFGLIEKGRNSGVNLVQEKEGIYSVKKID